MKPEEIEFKLHYAVTEYDMKQSRKPHHSPYALGIYFERVEAVMADIAAGATPRRALCAAFNDRLLDHCLKAIGEAPFKREEISGLMFYRPASEAKG